MPDADYFYALIFVTEAMDNPIGAMNDLSQKGLIKFRNGAAHFRKVGNTFDARD
jgi:hypothetical protein